MEFDVGMHNRELRLEDLVVFRVMLLPTGWSKKITKQDGLRMAIVEFSLKAFL